VVRLRCHVGSRLWEAWSSLRQGPPRARRGSGTALGALTITGHTSDNYGGTIAIINPNLETRLSHERNNGRSTAQRQIWILKPTRWSCSTLNSCAAMLGVSRGEQTLGGPQWYVLVRRPKPPSLDTAVPEVRPIWKSEDKRGQKGSVRFGAKSSAVHREDG
jgi:hypothetical protein